MRFVLFLTLYICACLHFTSPVLAQETHNYSKAYQLLVQNANEKAYSAFMQFHSSYPANLNCIYQLGRIMEQWSYSCNPVTQMDAAQYYINRAFKYYKEVKTNISQDEVNNNKRFYQNIDSDAGEITIETIIKDVDTRMDKLVTLERYYRLVNHVFSKTNAKYTNAIKVYKSIIDSVKDYNVLLLTSNENTMRKMEQLEMEFDSTLYFLKKFNEICTTNNLPYPNDYKLKNIDIYRVDGLTRANFLSNPVEIWDFGKWCSNFRTLHLQKIDSLNQTIDQVNKDLLYAINAIQKYNGYSAGLKTYRLNEKSIRTLRSIDPKTVIEPLFRYLNTKIDLHLLLKHPLSNPQNYANEYLPVKQLTHFQEIIATNSKLDSLLTVFKQQLSEEQMLVYHSFFQQEYGLNSQNDIIGFIEQERKANHDVMEVMLKKIQQMLVVYQQKFRNKEYTYKNNKIRLLDTIPDFKNSESNEYYVINYTLSGDKHVYFTGFIRSFRSIKPFLGRADATKVQWVVQPEITMDNANDYNHCGKTLYAGDNTCTLVIHSKHKRKNDVPAINTILRFDGNGNLLSFKQLEISTMPRCLHYNFVNNSILAVFKGEEWQPYEKGIDTAQVYFVDALENTWTTDFTIEGHIAGVFQTYNQYAIVCDFSKLVDTSGELLLSETGGSYNETNTAIFFVDNKGNKIKVSPYYADYSSITSSIIKINSNRFALLGIPYHTPKQVSIPPNFDNHKFEIKLIQRTGKLLHQLKYLNTN